MTEQLQIMNIGCIIMASGQSARYGRNKLLELLGGSQVILHTVDRACRAGLDPVTVTRSVEVKELLDRQGSRCILHDKPLKSDTMHIGIESVTAGIGNLITGSGDQPAGIEDLVTGSGSQPARLEGFCFWPGDQPLVLPETVGRLIEEMRVRPEEPVRLGCRDDCGSPVIFPASFLSALLSYQGDRGGMEILKEKGIACRIVQASYDWELWDVDTPECMDRVRKVYERYTDMFR